MFFCQIEKMKVLRHSSSYKYIVSSKSSVINAKMIQVIAYQAVTKSEELYADFDIARNDFKNL